MEKNHEEFIANIALAFSDIRNEEAETKFARNRTFQKEFKLDQGERILYLNHRNLWFARFQVLAPTSIFIITLIILMNVINISFLGETFRQVMIALIIMFIIFIGVIVIITSIAASSFRYIITDRRVIIGYTFIRRWVRSIFFSNIVDLVVRQGLFSKLFRSGTILIITASDEGALINTPDQNVKNIIQSRGFINIKNPFRVKKLLSRLAKHFAVDKSFIPQLEHTPIDSHNIDLPERIKLGEQEVLFRTYNRKRASSFFKILGIISVVFFSLLQLVGEVGEWLFNSPYFEEILIYGGIGILVAIIGIFWISKFHAKAFRYIVTNQRIVFYNDFINIRCRDAIMGKITEVSLGQILVGRIGDFGDIKIATKGYEGIGAKRGFNSIEGISQSTHEKDIIQNIVLYFQKGEFYNPLIEIYDPEFLSI